MNLPDYITDLAETIRDAGGRAMLVGGCVRDELMGVEPKDWDVEVYGIEPGRLKDLLVSFAETSAADKSVRVPKIRSPEYLPIPEPPRHSYATQSFPRLSG